MAGVSDQDLDSAFDAILGSLSTSSKPSATPAPVISPAPETPKAPTKPKASFEEIDALTSALLSPIVIKKAAAGARPPPATPNPRSPRHGGGIPSPRADQAAAVRPADASPGVTAGTISSPPPVSAPPPAALPPRDRGAAAQPEPGNSDAVAPALPSMDDMLNSFMTAAPPAAAKVPPSATLPPPTILPPPAIGLPPPAAGGLPPPSAGLPPPSGGLPPLQGGLLPPPDFLFLPPPPPPSEPEQEQGSPTGGAPPAVAAMRHPSPGRQSPASAAPPIHSSTLSKWLNKSSAGAKPPAAPADQASPGSPSTSASLTVPQQAPQQAGGAATGGSPPVASLVPSASTPSVSTIASPPPVAVSVSSPTLSGQAKAPAEALEPPRPAAQKTMLSATPPAKPSGTLQKTASGPLDAASVQPAAPSVTKQPVRPVSVFEPPNPAKAPNGVLPKSGSTGSLVPPAPTAPAGPPVVFAANKDELVVHDAVKSGQQARVMEVLAKHKSLINVRNSSEQSPLHVASQLGYQEIVNLLIANGAFLDAVDRSHWTAVHYASAGGHISTVRTLVTAGCSLGIRNDVGCTLLHYLMACGVPKTEKALFRIVVLEVVRAAGFDMNARNNAGSTALHQAAFRGKKWNMKVLLVHNPDVAVQTKLGETALHFAARRGDVKIVQMLLDKGASPDVKAETGTALDLAHAFKHEGVISVLTPVTSVPLTTVEATYEDIWRSQASLAETANRKPPTDTTRKQRGATEAGAVVVTPAEDEAHPPAQPQPQPHKSDKSNLLTRRLSTMFAKKEDVVAEQSHPPQPALRGSSPGSVESSSLAPEDKKAKAGLSKRLSMALFSDDKDKKEKKEKEKKDKDKEKKDKDDKEAREKEQQHKKDSAPASPAATAAAAPTPASASAAATTTAASPAAPSPTAAATPVDTDTVRRKKKGGMFGSLSQAFTGHGKDESKDIVFSNPVLVSSTLDLDAMPAKPRPMPAAEPPTPPVAKSETVARTNSVSSTPPAVASPLAASPSSPMNAQPATAGAPAPSAPPAVPALPPSAPTGVASPKSSRYNLHGASPRPGASIVDSLFRELDPSEREALIASPAFKRQKVLEEIINTEKEYVQDLESMINLFLLPLRTKNVIHTTDITDIFSNVETIFDVNTQLLASLTKGDPIGLAFLNMSEQLKNYSVYMANQDHSTASFERCKKTYPDLMPFLTSIFDANPQLRNSNLDNMLIKPVQRICKYPLLLDQLLKYTATTDADYDNIGRAKGAIEKVCEYIDVKILEYASRMKLKEIEPQIADLPEDFSIVPPEGSKQGRAYIKDWECKVSAKSDTRPSKIYLFDDMLLWTAAGLLDNMVGRNKKRLRYRDHVPYTEMLMKETNGQIVITHVGVREFTINPESEFDKEQMKNDIEKAADDLLKRNYNDIYGAIPESDRVSFADYKKNLQRQLEFIPLPVEMAKRGVSTRKENEVFALGAVALVSDLNSVTGTPPLPATSSPPSGHSGSTIISRTRDMSPAHVAAPLSLQAPLTLAQVQTAAAAARVPTAPAGARTKQLLNSSGSSGVAAPAPTAPANTSAAPSFQEGEEEVLEAR